MPGGRPRNAWTATRERKLARLFTLTELELDDIRVVLKADGFDPCKRDIQKRLGILLSKEYSRHYHDFRPANHDVAKSRFSIIRACRNGRIGKGRRARRKASSGIRKVSLLQESDSEISSRCGSAFIDYYKLPSDPSLYIPPRLLDKSLSPPNTTIVADGPSPIPSRVADACPPDPPTEPVPVNVPNTGKRRQPSSVDVKVHHNLINAGIMSAKPKGDKGSTKKEKGPSPASTASPASETSQIPPQKSPAKHKRPLSILSVSSLERRFANRHSHSVIEHVNSIMCYSSSNSGRSSLVSMMSLASSFVSRKSRETDLMSVNEDDHSSLGRSKSAACPTDDPLTTADQSIWDELIDESQLIQSLPSRPYYPEISLLPGVRPCCPVVRNDRCRKCGYLPPNILARDVVPGSPKWSLAKTTVNTEDDFGNNSLHVAAASGTATLSLIMNLIDRGGNIHARNSSGETFMHVLNTDELGGLPNYCKLLKVLRKNRFPFTSRDYHGRTVAHRQLEDANLYADLLDAPKAELQDVLSTLMVDRSHVDALDNRGEGIKRSFLMLSSPDTILPNGPEADLWFQTREAIEKFINSDETISAERVDQWLKVVSKSNNVNWIYENGDTLLVTILKRWAGTGDETSLERIFKKIKHLGPEWNMRDRNGETPLAIAACRGLRPAVKCLLQTWANPNTRNYRGVGIVVQARKKMRRGRSDGNSGLYARILSCINLIIDSKGVLKPTVFDEYASFERRRAIALDYNVTRVGGY